MNRTRDKIERMETRNQNEIVNLLRQEGHSLYHKLFSGKLALAFAQCQTKHTNVRIRLSFVNAPELWQVPWEALCSPEVDQPLACSVNTSLVRWSGISPPPPPRLIGQGPLRLLILASSIGGDTFDEQEEISNLLFAVQPLIKAGQLIVESLLTPTLSKFRDEWTRQAVMGIPYHLLHIIGHGIYDNNTGQLIFSDGAGGADPVDTRRLALILANDIPHLIFLNLCKGAMTGYRDAFAGVAQNLIRHGVPTVVGMQFSITNTAAIVFSKSFYEILSWGGNAEEAVIRSRSTLLAENHRVEWVTPVLLMQNESVGLISIPPDDHSQQVGKEEIPEDQPYFFDLTNYVNKFRSKIQHSSGLIGFVVPHAEDKFLDALTKRLIEIPKLREGPGETIKKPTYRLSGYFPWNACRSDVEKTLAEPGNRIILIAPRRKPEEIWNDICQMWANLPTDGYKIVILVGELKIDVSKISSHLELLGPIELEELDMVDWLSNAFKYKETKFGWQEVRTNTINEIASKIWATVSEKQLRVLHIYDALARISEAFGSPDFERFETDVRKIY